FEILAGPADERPAVLGKCRGGQDKSAVGLDELIPRQITGPGAFEQHAWAGHPAEQVGRAVGVVFEEEVADRVLLLARGPGDAVVRKRGEPPAVAGGSVAPV